MIGHDAAITAISSICNLSSSTRFISASCDGHMCLWELEDGRCIDSISSTLVHRFMQTYTYKSSRHTRSTRLFCVGDYSDIVVMDPNDLAVVFNLSSRVEPDWICSYDIVRRTNKLEQCIGISMAGMIKIWSLVELEKKDLATPLYEDESKRLGLRDVRSVSFNAVNERLLLTVCSDAFHASFSLNCRQFQDSGDVTCSLFVSSQGKLLIGRTDGLIVLTYACETLSCHLLEMPLDKPAARKLYGHKGRVSNLFYPHEHHPRFDPQVFLSGADDFAVIIWNIVTGVRLYRFSVHGGPILRFLIPPSNTSKLISKCICAVAADHSVSLLNIRDMKCALLASQHPHPVSLVKWRPLDDFMLVKLDNGSVYVWEMGTANMDRVVTGVAAEEVLTACDEQIGKEEGTDHTTASQAVVIMRALRYRGIDMVSSNCRANTPESNTRSDSPPTTNELGGVALGPPMSINQMPGCDQGTHLVQFEYFLDALLPKDLFFTVLYNFDFSRFNHLSELKLYLDIARLLLSLLHGWNLDRDLDAVCLKKLGLNMPKQQLYFGNISRHGQLSVTLPQRIQHSFDHYSTCIRWQTSHSLTTTHLLAVISTANTLMGIRNSPNKKLVTDVPYIEAQQYKQGWSLLAALHCVLLPDHIRPRSSYAAPRIELLSRRWQDSCVEIREAAQALLIRELSRLGPAGRRRLIESWTPFLPPLLDPALSIFGARLQSSVPTLPPSAPPIPPRQRTSPPPLSPVPEPATGEDGESGIQQVRRNQATAIILLGVVGSEFGEELNRADMTRATALSLLELLVAAPSALLPVHSPLRRAAIDLLGRGFVYWEPHLEISKVVLGLLDLAGNTEKSSFTYFRPIVIGAPLSSIADACRTARHSLTLIATARPTALLSALSMEVARYNAAAQHQTIQHTVVSPLLKSRSEVLRIIEELAEKRYNDVIEMMLPVGDVLVHCLDTSLLKQKTLADVFPPITKFPMVAYCASTRRIAFGGKNGTCVVHELRAAKAHSLQAHQTPVTAVAFSEDGKYLATYGGEDAKINFWQACQTFLGIGQSQMKLVKSQPAPAMQPMSPDENGIVFRPKMVWINSKALTLMLPEGREQRFSI
uniref:WD_REPEATS_REGION domain-containing protein n=1 Tax=Angiostrongylus cantonensis TaxID=6313 RepID=A0A158P8C8_ANGCA